MKTKYLSLLIVYLISSCSRPNLDELITTFDFGYGTKINVTFSETNDISIIDYLNRNDDLFHFDERNYKDKFSDNIILINETEINVYYKSDCINGLCAPQYSFNKIDYYNAYSEISNSNFCIKDDEIFFCDGLSLFKINNSVLNCVAENVFNFKMKDGNILSPMLFTSVCLFCKNDIFYIMTDGYIMDNYIPNYVEISYENNEYNLQYCDHFDINFDNQLKRISSTTFLDGASLTNTNCIFFNNQLANIDKVNKTISYINEIPTNSGSLKIIEGNNEICISKDEIEYRIVMNNDFVSKTKDLFTNYRYDLIIKNDYIYISIDYIFSEGMRKSKSLNRNYCYKINYNNKSPIEYFYLEGISHYAGVHYLNNSLYAYFVSDYLVSYYNSPKSYITNKIYKAKL